MLYQTSRQVILASIMTKKKLYVGCALSKATKEFRDKVFHLRDDLLSEYFEVLKFAWDRKTDKSMFSEVNVYEADLACVDGADIFVAICDEPSIGLGVEIERAIQKKKKIFAFHHKDLTIGKIVDAALQSTQLGRLYIYDNVEDIVEIVKKEA